jgi:nucleoid DNA-binding protein
MGGISSKILERIHVKCPRCAYRLDLKEFVAEVFSQILEEVRGGETIRIPAFGEFKARYIPSRRTKALRREGAVYVRGHRVIRFRANSVARKFLNADIIQAELQKVQSLNEIEQQLAETPVVAQDLENVGRTISSKGRNPPDPFELIASSEPDPETAAFLDSVAEPSPAVRKPKRRARPGRNLAHD